MGFDNHSVRFLLAARSDGASFKKVTTIGRQYAADGARMLRSVPERTAYTRMAVRRPP